MPVKKMKATSKSSAPKAATPQALQKTGDPLEVSQSTIKNWRRCHALYDYRYIQLLRRKRPIVQLIRGTMIGKCLDAMALHSIDKKAPIWASALVPFEKEYGRLFREEQEYYGDLVNDVRTIITRYEKVYETDALRYTIGKHGTPYEYPVNVSLVDGIVFTGHIDKLPMDPQGRVWDMDHKSHKRIPGTEDRFVDLQQVFYQWAAPLSGYPKLAGVIWDYVRTKPPVVPEELKKGGLTQRQNIDTDYETYMAEITRLKLNPKDYQKILSDLKPRGYMDFFLRVKLPAPNIKLITNVVADAKTTAIEIKRLGGVDKTRTVDRTCKSCEFFTLCQSELRGEDSHFIRKSEYEVNPDPRHVHAMDDE